MEMYSVTQCWLSQEEVEVLLTEERARIWSSLHGGRGGGGGGGWLWGGSSVTDGR